jgi:hypothetical protein
MATGGSTQQFVLSSQLLNYLTQIQRNLSQGQAPNIVIVHGGSGDLFDIAAATYGDCTLAFGLAKYNGLISPLLSFGIDYTILLPPLAALQQ